MNQTAVHQILNITLQFEHFKLADSFWTCVHLGQFLHEHVLRVNILPLDLIYWLASGHGGSSDCELCSDAQSDASVFFVWQRTHVVGLCFELIKPQDRHFQLWYVAGRRNQGDVCFIGLMESVC